MSVTGKDLYRALNKTEFPDSVDLVVNDVPVVGVLYPQFEPKLIDRRGRVFVRPPDMTPEDDNGVQYVSAGGTSLFDRKDVFGTVYWRSFRIPAGTQVPDSLAIRKGAFQADKNATHYQIEVRTGRMTLDALKGALDNLARNAIVKLCQDAR